MHENTFKASFLVSFNDDAFMHFYSLEMWIVEYQQGPHMVIDE